MIAANRAVGWLCAMWLLAAWPAAAQGPAPAGLDAILARGVLRVGLTGDYRPFSFRDPANGIFTGLDVDMAHSLASVMGLRLEIVPTTWRGLSEDLTAGRFDVAMGGVTITLARLKTAYFSAPVMRSGKTPIARCADQGKFQTLAQIDRPDVTVITNPGGTNESFDRDTLHNARIVVFPDNATIFDQLARGAADLMITDGVEARLQHKLHPELCAIHPDTPFTTAELGYMLPRDVPLKFFVDAWLHDLDISGAHAALVAQWLK
jgi:cyclohexadienyl dehydratase